MDCRSIFFVGLALFRMGAMSSSLSPRHCLTSFVKMPPQNISIKGIEKVIRKSHNDQVKNVEVTRLTAPGENYLSMVLGVKVDIERNGHSKTINAVAKRFPPGTKNLFFSITTMKNEINWYAEILPLLSDFAKQHGYKFENSFAPYYGSRFSLDPLKKEPDHDSILLVENLTTEGGYKMEDRYIGFDLTTAKEILKALAIFHGIPIAMKIRKPEQFEILKNLLESARVQPPKGPDGKPINFGPPPGVKSSEEMLLDAIADLPDCAPYVMKLEKLLLQERKMEEFFHSPGPEPWNTIVHGDLWLNNIMVRDKKDPRVKFLDFQLYVYNSYAKDLVFFLLTSVRNDVTREHLDDLLRYYYEEFTAVLKHTETNLNLTYEEFLQEVDRVAKQSESRHSLQFSTIVFAAKNAGVDTVNQEFDFRTEMSRMIQNMTLSQKDKLVIMASEIVRRNWL